MWVFFTYTHIIGGFVLDKVNWEGTYFLFPIYGFTREDMTRKIP